MFGSKKAEHDCNFQETERFGGLVREIKSNREWGIKIDGTEGIVNKEVVLEFYRTTILYRCKECGMFYKETFCGEPLKK